MAVVLALMAALAYGTSDFAGGLASRRFAAGPVTAVIEAVGLLTAAAAVVLFPGAAPSATVLAWGAVSGVGTAVGALSLYHGLSVGRMSIVATLSAVLTAVIPVVVGVALGNHLSGSAEAGIAPRSPPSDSCPGSVKPTIATLLALGCSTECSPAWDLRCCSSRWTGPARTPARGL